MTAKEWLGNDGYQYILFCTKEDALEIMSIFGKRAKAPTRDIFQNGIKYSFYLLNVDKKIITPYRSMFFGYRSDPDSYLVGQECTLAVILDSYRMVEYPVRL